MGRYGGWYIVHPYLLVLISSSSCLTSAIKPVLCVAQVTWKPNLMHMWWKSMRRDTAGGFSYSSHSSRSIKLYHETQMNKIIEDSLADLYFTYLSIWFWYNILSRFDLCLQQCETLWRKQIISMMAFFIKRLINAVLHSQSSGF